MTVMPVQNQETTNEACRCQRRRTCNCCSMTFKDWMKLVGNILVPLVLTIFTVVITFEQRNELREQRKEDREQAELQRDQDLMTARDQRELDKNISILQRETDKEIADTQRNTDILNADRARNESFIQRQHEIHIEEQRLQLAKEQRDQDLNVSRDQRELDQRLANDRYEQEKNRNSDALVHTHIEYLALLLERNNGTPLSLHSTTHVIARAKTFNIFRQVDSVRCFRIIQFLYDIGQLTSNHNPLDMTRAPLQSLNASRQSVGLLRPMPGLSLSGAYLMNASFDDQDISLWNLTRTNLNGATFIEANCTGTIFDWTNIVEANFSSAIISFSSFIQSKADGIVFYRAYGQSAKFLSARLTRANFTEANLVNTNFLFLDSHLEESIFHRAILSGIKFEFSNLTKTDMTDLSNPFIRISFFGCTLAFATFVNARLNADTTASNLSNANLTGAKDVQYTFSLEDTLSIHNAILPNGSRGPPNPNLVLNGLPQCTNGNSSFIDGWTISGNNQINKIWSGGKCIFAVSLASTGSNTSMLQKIHLAPKYQQIIGRSRAILSMSARMSFYTAIYVDELTARGNSLNTYKLQLGSIGMDVVRKQILMHAETKSVQVVVDFSRETRGGWLEFIEMGIDVIFKLT
jgi:uncharacterized protein YjbI with pentapeptide repeats